GCLATRRESNRRGSRLCSLHKPTGAPLEMSRGDDNLSPGTLRSSTSNTIFLLFFGIAHIARNTLCFSNIVELLAPKSHWKRNCNFQESPANDSLCRSVQPENV